MYCPDCGKELMFIGRRDDVPTYHDIYSCQEHGKWEFTYTRSDAALLHIAKGGE